MWRPSLQDASGRFQRTVFSPQGNDDPCQHIQSRKGVGKTQGRLKKSAKLAPADVVAALCRRIGPHAPAERGGHISLADFSDALSDGADSHFSFPAGQPVFPCASCFVLPSSAIMPRLLIATKNAHKTGEIRAILGDAWEVTDLNAHPEVPAPEETGTTFAENAAIKAVAASQLFAGFVLSDDSGLEVDALGGAPGVISARYAGDD